MVTCTSKLTQKALFFHIVYQQSVILVFWNPPSDQYIVWPNMHVWHPLITGKLLILIYTKYISIYPSYIHLLIYQSNSSLSHTHTYTHTHTHTYTHTYTTTYIPPPPNTHTHYTHRKIILTTALFISKTFAQIISQEITHL